MAAVNYKETELWQRAKALISETYRLTQGWPADGKGLAEDLRANARLLVRTVPGAFKRGGITGNVHLNMAMGNFAEFQALCEAAETLSLVPAGHLTPIIKILVPIEDEFRSLAKAARESAHEKRARMYHGGAFDDEDDDF